MGPEATIQFYKELIYLCQKKCGSLYDDEFPNIILYNAPIPNVILGIKNPKPILDALKIGTQTLQLAGADFITIPCNTINYFYIPMTQFVNIPILNIIEETAKAAKASGLNSVGILATKTTLQTRLYPKMLNKYGIKTIIPSNESAEALNQIILRILKGNKLKKDKMTLLQIIAKLKKKGA